MHLFCPFNSCVSTEFFNVKGLDCTNSIDGILIKVEFEDSVCDHLHDSRVADFPDCKGPAFEELLDAVLFTVIVEFRAKTLVRHALEDGCFNFLVDNFADEFTIKESMRLHRFYFVIYNLDLVADIAHACQECDFDLVHTESFPAFNVLHAASQDDLWLLSTVYFGYVICLVLGLFHHDVSLEIRR